MSYNSAQPIQHSFQQTQQSASSQDSTRHLSGEALARDPLLERYGFLIVILFIGIFAALLLALNLTGQKPGESFLLKDTSDIFQTAGQWIGFFFCLRIALRLRRAAKQLVPDASATKQELAQLQTQRNGATRAWIAWTCLAIGIACYGSAGVIWTSFDVRMPTIQVPYPGLYDIGYVSAYPFFLIGTVLLARRSRSTAGRTRLLLDALAVIGTALALSWFFVLGPSFAGLSQSPSSLAAFLAIYFPAGDLLLIAVGVLLFFSPLSAREQEPVLLRLCLGLCCLAFADSLLGYYNLTGGFNTGTMLDILWPLSLLLVGLAAIEYPRSVAREQEREANLTGGTQNMPLLISRFSQVGATLQTIIPFILVLLTCAILLLVVVPQNKGDLRTVSIIAIALVIIIIIRQALTLLENNRLTMQMRGELVVSRRELQFTQREANKVGQLQQTNQEFAEGLRELQEAHARIARGDFTSRVASLKGPLMPVALSLNLMVDRLNGLAERTEQYALLEEELQVLRAMLEKMNTERFPLTPEQAASRSRTTLRSVFMAVSHAQRTQKAQWQRIQQNVALLQTQTLRLSKLLSDLTVSQSGFDSALQRQRLENALKMVELMKEQLNTTHNLLPTAEKEPV